MQVYAGRYNDFLTVVLYCIILWDMQSADPVVAVKLNLMHVCKSPQVHNVGSDFLGYSFDQLES